VKKQCFTQGMAILNTSHAFQSYECPYKILMHNEWHIQRIPKQLHGHLHGCHLELFFKSRRTFLICTYCSQQISQEKVVCQIVKMFYHHSKVEFLGATWSSTMAFHWIRKKIKLLKSSLFGKPHF
jgi:hypothetical protein